MSSPPEPLRLALLGFGQLAEQVYTPLLRRQREGEVVAVIDSLGERRTLARSLFPCAEVFASQAEMPARADCAAVLISAATGAHADLAMGALSGGQHVYLEKPAAAHLADARRLVQTWRGAGRVGMMGFNYRFSEAVQAARAQLQAGRIGRPRMMRTVFSAASRSLASWKKSRQEGGGVLLDLGSHHIDLIRYLSATEIQKVDARIRTIHTEDDAAVLQMTLRNGMEAQSYFSRGGVEEDVIEIHGDNGKLTVDRYGLESVQFTPVSHWKARWQRMVTPWQSIAPRPRLWRKLKSPWHEPSYALALNRFFGAVRSPSSGGYPDFEDGLRCQMVMDAAERSSREEKSIACEEIDRT